MGKARTILYEPVDKFAGVAWGFIRLVCMEHTEERPELLLRNTHAGPCYQCEKESCSTLTVQGVEIACTCGYKMKLDAYGFLKGEPQIVSTTAQWEQLQNEVYRRRFESGLYFAEDHDIPLYEFKEDSRATEDNLLCKGKLTGHRDRLVLGEHAFLFDKIEKMEIMMGGRWLVFGYDGHHYMLSEDNGCLNKYIELYRWGKADRYER